MALSSLIKHMRVQILRKNYTGRKIRISKVSLETM